MRRIVFLFSLVVLPVHAGVISFSGVFTQDDDVWSYGFSLGSTTSVTLRTWSFAGGTNGHGEVIAAGGFAPVLSLFDSTGLLLGLDHNGGSGPCGSRATDPGTGYCWDAFLNLTLAPGSYLVTLTQDDNLPLGPTLADGFLRSGQGNFTGPNFLGTDGQCVLADGTQRSCAYAVDIVGPDPGTPSVPEPSSLVLCALGLGLLLRTKEFRASSGSIHRNFT